MLDEEKLGLSNVTLNYDFDAVCKDLKVPNPSRAQVETAFESLGYKLG